MADLYDHIGEFTRAEELRRQAESLRARFNRDFWWEDQGTYILALERAAKGSPSYPPIPGTRSGPVLPMSTKGSEDSVLKVLQIG